MRINRKVLLSTVIVVLSLLLFGCKEEGEFQAKIRKSKGYKLYYVNSNGEKIVSDEFSLKTNDIDRMINEIIMKLKVGNYLKSKEPVIPKTVEASSYTLNANILNLNFDEKYLELKGRDEVLRRAAIVLTLCQLEQVEYVRITVAGNPLQSNGNDIGNMSKESFIDMIGEKSDYMIDTTVSLYYADSSGRKLRKLSANIKSDGTQMLEELVVKKIIEGPIGSDKLGYYKTVNSKTRVNRVAVNRNICYVDLSEEFLDREVDVSEDVIIYSIVNSLTELTTVNQVKITVDGEVLDVYSEYSKMSGILERNYDIINEGKNSSK